MAPLTELTNEVLKKMDKLEIYSILTGNLENKAAAKDSSEKYPKGHKPLLELNPIENTAVHTPTQEIYNELMRVYEGGNWRWLTGSLPTEVNGFKRYKEKTCVDAKNGFEYCNGEFYLNNNFDIISPQDFYKIQKITPEMLKEINKYFEGGR